MNDDHVALLRAEVSNYMRCELVAADFDEDGGLFEVGGASDNGKTSFALAIIGALGGKDESAKDPIRTGAEESRTFLKLTGYTVEVVISRKPDGSLKRTLVVRNSAGIKQEPPQTVLRGFLNTYAIDPVEFSRQADDEQVGTLKRMLGLDFSKLDAAREDLYRRRADVNKAAKTLKVKLDALPVVNETKPVDCDVLQARLVEANEHNTRVGQQRQQLADQRTAFAARRATDDAEYQAATKAANDNHVFCRETAKEIEDLEARLAVLRNELDKAKANQAAFDAEVERTLEVAATAVDDARSAIDAFAESIPDPQNTAAILAEIRMANTTNDQARAFQAQKKLAAEVDAEEKASRSLTTQIDKIDAEKKRILAETQFPIAGLGLDDRGVIYQGQRLSQCSSSQRYEIGLALAAALHPKLRLIFVREGSLLDWDKKARLRDWAKTNGYLVIFEVVAKDVEGPGVVIVDGRARDEVRAPVGTEA